MKTSNNLNSSIPKDIFKTEWLETNGLGTWASSTVSGINASRYHGLLITKNNKSENISLLSKLEESLVINKEYFSLSANQYPGTVYPSGYQYLSSFKKKLFPEFIYEANGIVIKKQILAIYESNITVVLYELLEGAHEVEMELLPLISSRKTNELTYQNAVINKKALFNNNQFSYTAYKDNPNLLIKFDAATYQPAPTWYNSFEYETDRLKGDFYREDLFSPGKFVINLNKNEKYGIIISDGESNEVNALALFEKEANRRSEIIGNSSSDFERKLKLGADQFIIKNKGGKANIKSGYFNELIESRTNIIAHTGLLVSTHRLEEAKEILLEYSKFFKKGLLPESINTANKQYQAADISLWFFNTTFHYFKYTEDTEFVFKVLMPVMKDVIAWFLKGSNNNICVDNDGLVVAGSTDLPATWMNACNEGWAITPRVGKAVEINALWYNALKIYAYFLNLQNQEKEVNAINDLAENIKKRFKEVFWNKNGQFLYDLIDETHFKNDRIRPNQLFAISLPFPIITGNKALKVLQTIENKLLTKAGIRTLCVHALEYKPTCEGNEKQRKFAYHEGTIWAWLTGPYIDATIRLEGNKGKLKALSFLNSFKENIENACFGSISEMFNASGDHTPAGLGAYALSVAEILRVGTEYNLFDLQSEDLVIPPINKLIEENDVSFAEEMADYQNEEDVVTEDEYEESPETEYHDEDLVQFNNPFSVISAFRSPGSRFARIFSNYNLG
ncbi:MAG: amylo-alpha-1,6-glucosidase [Bacteroidota bacterium]